MKIIILGAGQVGATLAAHLANEDNDITVVDVDTQLLKDLQDHLDIRTVQGHCSYPVTLRQAGADDADMLIAVTNSDETNMMACQIADTLFNTPTKIARVRATQYLNFPDLFHRDAIPVDVMISPEKEVSDYIIRLIEYPGALQVLDFADGLLRLVALRAYYGGPLVGNQLSTLREHMPHIDSRVAAIFRKGQPIMPTGDTVIDADDEVFFIAARKHIRAVMSELQELETPYQKIMIAGGGNIGLNIAKALEVKAQVKILEKYESRCELLHEELNRALIIQGEATNESLLNEEDIETFDVFIAVTNDDEANILSAMLAKRMGVKKTMVLIKRGAYADLVQGHEIDVAISPQQATIGSLLTHVRRGDVANVYSLRRGAAEALETVAHGDETNSKVVGKRISDLDLPDGCSIGAVVRKNKVLIAHSDVVIETNDHVILFLVDKSFVREVEQLFQVDYSFF
jgi:trk system potassium uptake protein